MSTRSKPIGAPPMTRRLSSFEFASTSNMTMMEKIADKLEAIDEDKRKTRLEIMKISTKHFLEHTWMGGLYNQIMLSISVLSCFEFIYQTYLDPLSQKDVFLLDIFSKLELVLAGLFGLDWFLLLFVSDHFWSHLLSFYSAVDMLTIIGICSTYKKQPPEISKTMSSMSVLYFVLCFLGTVRILRALRFKKYFHQMEDEVQRFLANMGLDIVVMILFNSAVMQYLEVQQNFSYHTWTYYMLVTVTTVGYGDITPQTDLGRFAAMCMICFAIITVPKMTNELIEKMSQQSIYARASYHGQAGTSKHVLICGDTKSSSMLEFFEELFHEDHHMQNLHAVILQPEAPSYEMLTILKNPKYSLTVTYLEGNALNEKDLDRGMAGSAKAIFIMTNKFSADPDEEDAKTILQQFSIQRYLRANSTLAKGALFCMQLIRPENKRHLVTAPEGSENSDIVACLNEIKMGVIAKAVMFPGANTLIMNLLTSFADEEDEELNGNAGVQHNDELETLDDDVGSDWIGEYQRGCDWEIYTTELSDAFANSVFCHLSDLLYQKLGVVLFALEIEDKRKDKSGAKLLLNPAMFVIPSQKDFKIAAFVLAKNKAQSDLSFSKPSDQQRIAGANITHLSLLATNMAARMSIMHPTAARIAPNEEGGDVHGKKKGPQRQMWQELLRNREIPKTSESIQEENHKEEDKYLRDNHFLRDHVIDMPEALIRTSVMEEMPYVDNHIIIIGKALSNLYDLIRPLRSRHLGVLKHIVILYPHDFPIAVWQRISIFESIWIVRGSALDEADIRRAGIFKAKQVVVLADASSQKSHSTGSAAAGLDALVDADAIFCYQCVRRMNESAHVVVEIVRHTNVGYLDPESGMNSAQIDYKFTPQFASGALFASSFLDTLVCQAFYNTKIIEVVSKLIGSTDNKDNKEGKNSPSRQGLSPAAAMLGSSLYQINIPEGLESRTYGKLYTLLAKRQQIPLGILRGVFPHTKCGPLANKAPYVFTNPPKDTELFSCDKVFVLSQTPIKIGKVVKDDSKEMHIYHGIRNKKKTTEDVLNSVNVLRDELKNMSGAHTQIDAKLANFAEEIDRKFDALFSALNVKAPALMNKLALNSTGLATTDSPKTARPKSAKPPK